jgi:3-hydroxy-9,10-secoandrosta-1,3,5(10)-triene-9,17-dione monooxygenase reductase component
MTTDLHLAQGAGLDLRSFKEVMAHFATGVAVITAVDGSVPVGLTCQSLVSLSLEPPLLGFAASKRSLSWPRIAQAGRFGVNVLSSSQRDLCEIFARSGTDKFSSIAWRPSSLGSPLLAGTLAWADCEIETVHEAGDHDLVIGRVREIGRTGSEPLVYFGRMFGSFAPLEP